MKKLVAYGVTRCLYCNEPIDYGIYGHIGGIEGFEATYEFKDGVECFILEPIKCRMDGKPVAEWEDGDPDWEFPWMYMESTFT